MNRKDRRAGQKHGDPSAQLLAIAVQAHQAGRLLEADGHYRKILSLDRNHAQAAYYLGLVGLQSGRPEMGIFVAAPPGRPLTAFAGPVVAYQEHVTTVFLRLSDEEWQQLYQQGPPARPDWTHVYLADAGGNLRLTGRRLVSYSTSTLPPAPPPAARIQLAQNVPNPFNPSTRISFRLDVERPVAVHLGVYDRGGRLVRHLVRETLPSGTYHVAWDGTDRLGHAASSGVYWARLVAGGDSMARKLVLVR